MTREEFDTMVSDFLEEYHAANGYYEGEWLVISVLIHCRTPGCIREGIPEESHLATPVDGVWKMVCGRCSHPVEDLDPRVTDDPDYRLPARYPDGSSWMVVND